MLVKTLEIRDEGTFIPVICIHPTPANAAQRYLLRRDGYSGQQDERCIIMVDAQCRGCAYDPYEWTGSRTKQIAHDYIRNNWAAIKDGDVIDVQFILGETEAPKVSEAISEPIYGWWRVCECVCVSKPDKHESFEEQKEEPENSA